MTDHVSACRCIWCASDPDKVRECGAPHPYAGSACARPSGHTGGHGNSHRAWLAEALSEAPSVTQEGSGADRRFVSSTPSPTISAPRRGLTWQQPTRCPHSREP